MVGTDVHVCKFGGRELRESHLMAHFNGNLEGKSSAESEVEVWNNHCRWNIMCLGKERMDSAKC